MSYRLRRATFEDKPALEALISLSARTLCAPDYTSEQIEAALTGAFGVDSELIQDGSYYVIECDGAVEHDGQPVACGGWSRFGTLFGGDAHSGRSSELLDPATQSARIRAFFVHPEHARAGLGRMLLDHCTAEARRHGFRSLQLMATLTGAKLYARFGFMPGELDRYQLTEDVSIDFLPMLKTLDDSLVQPSV